MCSKCQTDHYEGTLDFGVGRDQHALAVVLLEGGAVDVNDPLHGLKLTPAV